MKKVGIKKHSSLIQMKNINLESRKAFNYFIHHAKEQIRLNRNEKHNEFQVDITSVKKAIGSKNNVALKRSIIGLMETVVEYNILGKDKNDVWGAFQLLTDIEIEKGIITYSLPKKIRETIENPSMYAILDLVVIKNLTSKYSLALYELIEDYKNLHKKHITLEYFKTLMGIDGKTGYTKFSDIKRRILDSSIEEINEKTPFTLSYDVVKLGRQVKHLEFHFHYADENKYYQHQQTKAEEFDEFRNILRQHGLDKELFIYENKTVALGFHDIKRKYYLYFKTENEKNWLSDAKALVVWKILMQNKQDIIGKVLRDEDELSF